MAAESGNESSDEATDEQVCDSADESARPMSSFGVMLFISLSEEFTDDSSLGLTLVESIADSVAGTVVIDSYVAWTFESSDPS